MFIILAILTTALLIGLMFRKGKPRVSDSLLDLIKDQEESGLTKGRKRNDRN